MTPTSDKGNLGKKIYVLSSPNENHVSELLLLYIYLYIIIIIVN
jgi:hypothetical protein